MTARNGDSDEDRSHQEPSLAEKAYDKTSYLVQSVKGLLVSGISKIKSYIGGEKAARKSRSRVKIGREVAVEESESSYERYKTPVGRSKSRTVAVNPIMAESESDEEAHQYRDEERKRHVNFNINRVVTGQPAEGNHLRPKSAAVAHKKTI